VTDCPACVEHPRGICFRHKLRTLQFGLVPGAVQQERSRSYYDAEGIAETFGADSKDRMLEQTKGLGYAKTVNGELMHRDRKTGDVVRVTQKELDSVYLAGDTEQR
jgi:hypothetical protein